MRVVLGCLLAGLMTISLTGCGAGSSVVSAGAVGSGTDLSGKLIVTGSSTVAPVVAEIARRFEGANPEVRIDVQSGGSGKGIADTRNGIADIGMASRALKGDEADLTAWQIAADGVCLIVHESNPLADVSADAVVAIYTDQIHNWNQLSGPDLPITVVHKAEGRATLEVFLNHFELNNPDIRPDVVVGDNEHGIKTVAGSPGAIGYVSIGTAEADVRAGVPIRLLSVGGVEASTEAVAAGRFPLSRPLNLVTGDHPNVLAAEFIRYCQSEDVHDLIVEQYFVPVQH